MAVGAVGRGGRRGGRGQRGLLLLLLASQQQDHNHGDDGHQEKQSCEACQHGKGVGVGLLSAGTLQLGVLQDGVLVMGPWLALAHHHAICAVQSDVLDVGPAVVFDTYILGQSRVKQSRSGTPLAVH